MLTVVAEDGQRREDVSLLDDIVQEEPRRMLAAVLEAEVNAYLAELAHERDKRGRCLVVRNGHAQPRQVTTSADGALGFWAALREVFPDTREQRGWVRKTANVLAALPKSVHPGAKAALAEIWGAEDKRRAQAAAKRFADLYGAKFAKAVAKVTDDLDVLLTFYDYPAEH